MAHDCIIVGAGASALAAATALLAAGREVLMVDVGLTLEPARDAMVAEATRPVNAANAPWAASSVKSAGVPKKLLYGSDFPFRDAAEGIGLKARGVGAEPSFAFGGLTNVWGAAALPFAAEDTADWPIRAAELAPHYAACAALLGLCEDEDGLSDWFPLHAPYRGRLKLSNQAQHTLRALERHRAALHATGLRFGRARLAVNHAACTYCGLCLHGCPDRLIFSAAAGLAALRANPRFTYRSDIVIEALSEEADSARALGRERQTGARVSLEGRQLFLAAGALPSTGILLRSAGAYDTPVRMLDSQYFLAPMLMAHGASDTASEPLHTMAQLFLELRDPRVSSYTVHLQLYTYNRLMADAMRTRLGPWLEPLARWGDARMMLIQGYLHSAHSGAIALALRRAGDREVLEAVGQPSAEAKRKVGAVAAKLLALAPRLGAAPITPLMEITEPGRGFHIGGSFPMRARPGRFETDTLGRPFGWTRTHVVDASVLPSIPATTITFPVMANAHRIATLAGAA